MDDGIRPLIECFFNQIKPDRPIFSRFANTARHYLRFGAVLIWLR